MDWKQEVFKRLDALAEKLGVAVQYLWGVCVRQAWVEGIGTLLLAILCGAGAGIATYALFGWFKRLIDGSWDDFGWMPFSLVTVGTVALYIATAVNLIDGVQHLLNPAYYALKLLGDAIR